MADDTLSLLEHLSVEPKQECTSCVIWLHGLGADGHDFQPLVEEFTGLANTRFIFPHAPIRPITLNGGAMMRGWYDIPSLNLLQYEDLQGIKQSADELQKFVSAQVKAGVSADKIVVAGFSQGGAIALYYGLRCKQPLAGVMALSTYLPLAQASETECVARTDLPIFYAHGTLDQIVPYAVGEISRQKITDLNLTVDWHSYTMMHQVCPQEMTDINRWLQKVLR